MKLWKFTMAVALASTICSCQTYVVSKSSPAYQAHQDGNDFKVKKYTCDHNSRSDREVKIKEEKGYVVVSFSKDPNEDSAGSKTIEKPRSGDYRNELVKTDKVYYYPDPDFNGSATDKRFKYQRGEVSFSVINLTYKRRDKIRSLVNKTTADSFPITYSTGFKPAFAGGYSYNWYSINSEGKKFKLQLSGGAFVGFSTITLDKNSTRQPVYTLSRNNPLLSWGGYINFGVQKFDVGIALGQDWAIGPYARRWVYHKTPFVGLIFGFDIVGKKE